MTEHRDRAAGWQHAKRSGHENEAILEELMLHDPATQHHFLERVGKPNEVITHIDIGGLHEKNVPCIFPGETTKSKSDMYITLSDASHYNVSIKKSLGGQVYLISATRFINGFEIQYHKTIPEHIKRAIYLFWGYSNDVCDIVNAIGTQKPYETRKHRLVASTLQAYDASLYEDLLGWFKSNMYDIANFCFSKGLAKNERDWATVVWYKNELGENQVDDIFVIDNLCMLLQNAAKTDTFYGKTGGGTTIQLPFGFVQWHSPTKKIPGDMQFHHGYEKIRGLVDKARGL